MTNRNKSAEGGFTLIEMIVVMAVSAILLTIIAFPLIQSFNITRQVQLDALGQEKSRAASEQIGRELAGAAAVYDNTGARGLVSVSLPGADGTVTKQMLPSARLALVKVAEGEPGSVSGGYLDPDTGKVDPTLQAPKGQPVFPVAPGDVVVMYVVGLKDPFRLYNNTYGFYKNAAGSDWGFSAATRAGWSSQFQGEYLARQSSNEDNLYVLYRIEVNPYKWVGGKHVVNTELFVDKGRVDLGVLNLADPVQKALRDRCAEPGPDVNDPYLLDLTVPTPAYATTIVGLTDPVTDNPADLSTSAKAKMVRALLKRARIVTDVSRMDVVMPETDRASRKVQFKSNVPLVSSLTTFRPSRVNSEPASAASSVRTGEETANAAKVGPEVYRTQFGSWDALTMRLFPSLVPASFVVGADAGAPRDSWTSGDVIDVLPNATGGLSVFVNGADELFDISGYQQARLVEPAYAFSKAVKPIGVHGKNFIPMVPDPRAGVVRTSFDVREFGNPADRLIADTRAEAYDRNVPSTNGTDAGIQTGPLAQVTDPTYNAPWTGFSTPNEVYSSLYQTWASLFPNPASAPAKDGPGGPKRFVSLRATPMFGASRTLGPLDPRNGIYRAAVTPGSERVYGPDQSPGGDPTKSVLYQRVPNVDSVSVGPNQYKINYVDKPEPDWATVFGFGPVDYDPTAYAPADVLSAILQEKYRAGYLELNSRPGEPLPTGNIYVTYRFQFTEPKDVVTVSYDSAKSVETIVSFVTYGPGGQVRPNMNTSPRATEVRNLVR